MKTRMRFYFGFFIGGMAVVIPLIAFAGQKQASAPLPIRTVLIQCGTQAQAIEACTAGQEACCAVIAPAAGDDPDAPQIVYDVYEADDGVIVFETEVME